MAEYLELKWGSLKGWELETEKSKAIAQRYLDLGVSMSAMLQRDTPEQKDLLCELVDAVNCDMIYLSWDGKNVSKEEAKKYIREYGKEKASANQT